MGTRNITGSVSPALGSCQEQYFPDLGVEAAASSSPWAKSRLATPPLPLRSALELGAAHTEVVYRKIKTVTAAVRRARHRYGDDLSDPRIVLRALGGPEFGVLTGVTLGAAARGGCCVGRTRHLGFAALVATRLEPAVAAHLVGQRSRETAHGMVLQHLGLEPLLDPPIRAGEGARQVPGRRAAPLRSRFFGSLPSKPRQSPPPDLHRGPLGAPQNP